MRDSVMAIRDKLRDTINTIEGEATLSMIAEAIAYLLIDIGGTALNLQQEITPARLKIIYDRHQKLPTLASALLVQGASMLGWLKDEELVSTTRITKQD